MRKFSFALAAFGLLASIASAEATTNSGSAVGNCIYAIGTPTVTA